MNCFFFNWKCLTLKAFVSELGCGSEWIKNKFKEGSGWAKHLFITEGFGLFTEHSANHKSRWSLAACFPSPNIQFRLRNTQSRLQNIHGTATCLKLRTSLSVLFNGGMPVMKNILEFNPKIHGCCLGWQDLRVGNPLRHDYYETSLSSGHSELPVMCINGVNGRQHCYPLPEKWPSLGIRQAFAFPYRLTVAGTALKYRF